MTHTNRIIVLMGPTGSGKSAMAMGIAARQPTVIINADAMQMVNALRVLTARPTIAQEAQAEHALYGVLPAQEPTSVAVWLRLVEPVIRAAWSAGKLPLLVGGTGMYVQSLMEGIAKIPPIPEAIRARVRALSSEAIRAELQAKDPAMAAWLKPGDTQRNARALEVIEATGESLAIWQKRGKEPVFPEAEFLSFYLDLPREEIYRKIDQRFEVMMENGALAEVEKLMAMDLPSDTPILRAHGAPELMAHLRGEMELEEAVKKAQQNTRNYAKRQMTWIRNQLPDAVAVRNADEIFMGLS